MKNWTPQHLRCGIGSCPAVYEKDDGQILVIGKTDMLGAIASGQAIGTDEFAVTLPREYFTELAKKLADEEASRNPLGDSVHDKPADELPW